MAPSRYLKCGPGTRNKGMPWECVTNASCQTLGLRARDNQNLHIKEAPRGAQSSDQPTLPEVPQAGLDSGGLSHGDLAQRNCVLWLPHGWTTGQMPPFKRQAGTLKKEGEDSQMKGTRRGGASHSSLVLMSHDAQEHRLTIQNKQPLGSPSGVLIQVVRSSSVFSVPKHQLRISCKCRF